MSGSNLLFVFTGSVAGYKACEAVSRLVQRGHHVRCVATAAALKFIGPATLEGLTGSPVRTGATMAIVGLSCARRRRIRSTGSRRAWRTICPGRFSWRMTAASPGWLLPR